MATGRLPIHRSKIHVRRTLRLAASLLIGLTLSGCIAGLNPNIKLRPEPSQELSDAIASAEQCGQPIPAKKQLSTQFKYGCFCGAGYPSIRLTSVLADRAMTREERQQLAVAYYSVKPVDEIDAACQAHDVCWMLNDRSEFECDLALYNELQRIEDIIEDRIAHRDRTSPAARCRALTRDIRLATLEVFPSGSRQWLMGAASRAFKIVTLPVTALYAMVISLPAENYPESSCKLDGLLGSKTT